MKFVIFLVVAFIAIISSCRNKKPAEKGEIGANYKDSLELCTKTADFLFATVKTQQQSIDSLQDELNKLTTVRR
ncbi:MAG TPA: hypothetical protein VM101_10120 [Flavitalea sp.]|nr:hypothetical protein [Flavitalea sp.]